ncbi:hypothetical protein GLYMA_11G150870v4 [Glycine max]|nr:hypothetical protein GLYMA_11G150870v4 [Glycine max]KAH1115964.1 hypothetical protein GYH30_057210 [Glycine max]
MMGINSTDCFILRERTHSLVMTHGRRCCHLNQTLRWWRQRSSRTTEI